MSDNHAVFKARIPDDFREKMIKFFEEENGYNSHAGDPDFEKLAERISGKVVEMHFEDGDAFEEIDNDFWIPNCCFEIE